MVTIEVRSLPRAMVPIVFSSLSHKYRSTTVEIVTASLGCNSLRIQNVKNPSFVKKMIQEAFENMLFIASDDMEAKFRQRTTSPAPCRSACKKENALAVILTSALFAAIQEHKNLSFSKKNFSN